MRWLLIPMVLFFLPVALAYTPSGTTYNLTHSVVSGGSDIANTTSSDTLVIVLGSVAGNSNNLYVGYVYTSGDWNAGNVTSTPSTPSTPPTTGGGGGGIVEGPNFILVTKNITIDEAGTGFSDFYEILLNASEEDTFFFEVPINCKVEKSNITASGLITNKVSCEKTEATYFDQINVRSSKNAESLWLRIYPPKVTVFWKWLKGKLSPLINGSDVQVARMTFSGYVISLPLLLSAFSGGAFLYWRRKNEG